MLIVDTIAITNEKGVDSAGLTENHFLSHCLHLHILRILLECLFFKLVSSCWSALPELSSVSTDDIQQHRSACRVVWFSER